MANIFENANLSVKSGYKAKANPMKIDLCTDTYLANAALRDMQNRQLAEEETVAMESAEYAEHKQELADKVFRKDVIDTQRTIALAQINSNMKTHAFKNIMCELFTKSLLLDEDFIMENSSNIERVVNDYIDNNGGFAMLENAIANTNSELLKRMRTVCEKCAKRVSERKLKESQDCETCPSIDFSMTPDEQKAFDFDKDEINPEEIEDLVKDKVLTVIKDEKNRQEKEDDLKTAIEEELKDDENVTDEKTAKEAVSRILDGRSAVEETTLFNALLRNTCNEFLVQSLTEGKYDTETTVDDISNTAPAEAQFDRLYDEDYDDSDPTDSDEDFADYNEKGDDYIGVDDDSEEVKESAYSSERALADTIAQYTLMEMLYTLKFEDYSMNNLRQISYKLIQPIKNK